MREKKEVCSPKTIEQAIALIIDDADFQDVAASCVNKILGRQLNYSNEFEEIAKDALQECALGLLSVIEKGNGEWEHSEKSLNTFGTKSCFLRGYLYESVSNYAKARSKRWGKDPKTGEARYRARDLGPIGIDESGITKEEWLSSLYTGKLKNSQDYEVLNDKLIQELTKRNVKPEFIEMVEMRLNEHSYVEIGKKIGHSPDAVRMRFKRQNDVLQKAVDKISM